MNDEIPIFKLTLGIAQYRKFELHLHEENTKYHSCK